MKSLNPKPSAIGQFQQYTNNLYGTVNDTRSLEYIYSYLLEMQLIYQELLARKMNQKITS